MKHQMFEWFMAISFVGGIIALGQNKMDEMVFLLLTAVINILYAIYLRLCEMK